MSKTSGVSKISKTKNKKPWFRVTEKLLFNYPSMEPAMNRLRAKLAWIDRNVSPSGIAKYDNFLPSKPSGKKPSEPEMWFDKREKARRNTIKKLDVLQAEKAAIDAALEWLDDDSRKLIELWYFQNWRLSKKGAGRPIWKELGMGSSTFTRRKAEIVEEVAKWLGEFIE